MNTTEFNKAITSSFLNENMFKKFGKRVDFDKYTREDLENYRNILRTKVSQVESGSKFNDLLANEDYQQDKHMLTLLNTRIKEMLGESKKKNPFADKNAAKDKDSKAPAKKKNPFAAKGEKDTDKKAASKKGADKFPFAKKGKEKKLSEQDSFRAIIRGQARYIAEDEEGKAKDITAGTDMVNDFTSWMQRVGQYQTKSMIELSDSIRANFGQADAETFKQAIMPALQTALDTLAQSRETIAQAVAVLAGEEGAVPMGQENVQTGDVVSAPDEFGASDAAVGGLEIAGRPTRESFARQRAAKLNEEHSIIRKLAQ